MEKFVIWVHIFTCIFMILTVLMQTGKGASIGSTFGGSSQTVFGTSGPTSILTKVTTVFAIIFMCTSLYLTYYASHTSSESIMDSMETVGTAPVEGVIDKGDGMEEATVPVGGSSDMSTVGGGEAEGK